MAIQFRCSQCGQPIEVDDEFAGRAAICPYCQHSVAVPAESTYRADEAALARPATTGTLPLPSSPPLPSTVSPTQPTAEDPRAVVARTYANYGLICVVLSIGLFLVFLVGSIGVVAPFVTGATATSEPAELVRLATPGFRARPWIIGAHVGSVFFSLTGVALGIVSLVQRTTDNVRGWLATACCAAFLLCNCSLHVIASLQSAA